MIRRFLRAFRTFYSYPYKRELITGVKQGWFPVFIRYPVYPKPRYGYNGNKPHPFLYEIINKGRDAYKLQLMVLKVYEDYLLRIKTSQPDDVEQPYWSNPWFSGLDAVALYGFLATAKPKLYVEIGSGNSTKFVKRAISDHNLPTKIVSVDPHPREEIDTLSDEIIRRPLEEDDLGLFDSLTTNDILFFDGTHRCFMNSDVTVFFLEVLPKLPSGILIHLHDIHLPYDYPPERALHYESEQYLLAAMFLAECSKYEIVLPNKFIVNDQSLAGCLKGLWDSKKTSIPKQGTSFWIRKT
jgi:hypothetical protein